MKPTLTLLAALLLAPLGALHAGDKPEPHTKPNVILFLVDDMGWMDSGVYGSKYYETPNIDRFAKSALRFTDAYSCPLCSPTRATLLTGQYSARHGITSATGHLAPQPADFKYLPDRAPANQAMRMPESKNYLEPSQITLAEMLQGAGYRTAHIGKWHLGLTEPHWPEKQGFDVAFHCHPDPGPPGNYFSPYSVVPNGAKAKGTRTGTITDGPAGEYIVDRLADEASKFIEANKDRPFFLNLWQYGVHGPWGHKEAYTKEFAKKKDPTGKQGNPIMGSMLRSVDESFGKILAKLDELKLTENTIVIFMSDNGGNTHSRPDIEMKGNAKTLPDDWKKWAAGLAPTNNHPLRDGKGRLYEGGIRVPLMIRVPGMKNAGATNNTVAGAVDIYPTVLDLLNLQRNPKQTIDGVSLKPVLDGGTIQRQAYFTWFPHLVPGVAVRAGDWKLIRRFEPRPMEYEGLHELFNLKDDLGETTNLAAKHPDKVKELNGLIDQFIKDTGAIVPQPNPDYKAAPKTDTMPDKTSGLVARSSELIVQKDHLRIEAKGTAPFLGIAGWKNSGAMTLVLRLRSDKAGEGKVHWKTADQAEFVDGKQVVNYKVDASKDWQEVKIELPADGKIGVLRLYLPGSIDVQEIAFMDKDSKPIRRWNFTEKDK
jgi:arylsulfatase A-like enzyme